MAFTVELNNYQGSIELLLFLVRKHEIKLEDLPLSVINTQFSEMLDEVESIDINSVGDFIEVAGTLIELKSKSVLPIEEAEEEVIDPRVDLVSRLLEYKKFKDAAALLDEQSRKWKDRFARRANDLPPRRINVAEQAIHEVELWDLVSAFGRQMREAVPQLSEEVMYDETPIHVYMSKIHHLIQENGAACYSELFEPGMHKSVMIGIFLAILELARHHDLRTEQAIEQGEILLKPGPDFPEACQFGDDLDQYG
ncbi:MAG: segregation/condensation protein A [Planctomycetota bacterium]|nr:segregation/condensation protein A [Planctomycetota bacterium]